MKNPPVPKKTCKKCKLPMIGISAPKGAKGCRKGLAATDGGLLEYDCNGIAIKTPYMGGAEEGKAEKQSEEDEEE